MRTSLKIVFIAFLLWFLAPFSRAEDKVILKEGKVIHGRIIDETPDEITVKFRSTMVLRIAREKISEIVREKKKAPANILRMQDLKKKPEEKKQEKPPAPDVRKTAVKNAKPGTKSRVSKKGSISVQETVRQDVYDVAGTKFQDVYRSITDRRNGKGFPGRRYRRAVSSDLHFSMNGTPRKEGNQFRWESVVLVATITIRRPRWNHPKNPPVEDVNQWNAYYDEIERDVQNRIDVYVRSLFGSAERIDALRLPGEAELRKRSDEIVREEHLQAEKRIRGYRRRHRIVPPKK